MTFYETLENLNVPSIYGTYKREQAVPYVSYTGAGQDIFWADNGGYHRVNLYQLVYYFKLKDETNEDAIEEALLDNGFTYEKGGDFYDSTEGVYYIIYSNIKSLKGGR